MGKNVFVMMALSFMFIVSGCSGSGGDVAAPTATPDPPTPAPTVGVKMKTAYGKKEKIPLVRGGQKYGSITVNKVTKLRFNDWSNRKAVENSVNSCYSVNMTVSYSRKYSKAFTMRMTPFFEKSGFIASSVANVGWSGFPDSAEFFVGGDTRLVVEVCVQPEVRLGKNAKFGIDITDSNGNSFEKVYLNRKLYRKAAKGPGLKKPGDEVVIHSAGGARYSIVPKAVSFEQHFMDYKDRDSNEKFFFDIKYTVKAIRKPKKNISVSTITGIGDSATIVCQAAIGLQPQGAPDVLYRGNRNAGRVEYSDTDDLFAYVTEGSVLRFGYKRDVVTNRLAGDGANTDVQKVRVRIEFPEEAGSFSDSTLLKFNGRFLVYELPVKQRKLGIYYK